MILDLARHINQYSYLQDILTKFCKKYLAFSK